MKATFYEMGNGLQSHDDQMSKNQEVQNRQKIQRYSVKCCGDNLEPDPCSRVQDQGTHVRHERRHSSR